MPQIAKQLLFLVLIGLGLTHGLDQGRPELTEEQLAMMTRPREQGMM